MATDHFHDDHGRYAGPIKKTNTAYPPSPYGDGQHCQGCGQHFVDRHLDGCPYASRWD